jgi:hypothetical protein
VGPAAAVVRHRMGGLRALFVLLAGLGWKLLMDAYAAARELVPTGHWIDVRFEDLLADPRSCSGRCST